MYKEADYEIPFYRRHPVVSYIVLVFLTIFSLFGARILFTYGEVSDFQSATCLGTWKNPSLAQGTPESFVSGSVINSENSAIFNEPLAQIFCGNFIPENFETKGDIKNVVLTLAWATEASLNKTTSTESEIIISPEVLIATSTPTSTEKSISNFHWIKIAHAQEMQTSSDSLPVIESALPTEPVLEAPTKTPILNTSTSSVPKEETPVLVPETQSTEVVESSIINSTSTEEATIEPTVAEENKVLVQTPVFLQISYSLDGSNWFTVADVSEEMIPNLTLQLPLTSWEDLKKLQIGISGIPSTLTALPKIFLDGMLLGVHYDLPPVLISSTGNIKQTETNGTIQTSITAPVVPAENFDGVNPPSFSGDQMPSFELDLDSLSPLPANQQPFPPVLNKVPSESFFAKLFRWFGITGFAYAEQNQEVVTTEILPTAGNPVVAKIFNHGDDEMNVKPQVLLANNRLRINVPQPPEQFVPGTYSLKVWVWKNGVIYHTENNFTWGVLAMNPNKSIYRPGETADIGIAVLDDGGNMVCNAEVNLEITAPDGVVKSLTTENGGIIKNPECYIKDLVEKPDYQSYYDVNLPGVYQTKLTAITANGTHSVNDSFEVQEIPEFDVERKTATRIYPPVPYPVQIAVAPLADFSGDVEERVPASFEIRNISDGGQVSIRNGEQIIRWTANLSAGEKKVFSYSYLAPDISPQFYLLGPLRVGNFSETRRWQIAADAVAALSARTFYGVTNNLGRLMWATGASNTTGAEIAGPVGTATSTGFIKGSHAPTRDEIMVGGIKFDGALILSKVVGGQDAAGDASLVFDRAGVTSAQACNATFGSCWRAFDIAYEQLSGEAMVAFASTTAGRLSYNLWDGSSWTPATTTVPSNVSIGGTGAIRWVRLIPRGEGLKGSRSDEILMIASDANSDIFAGIWNGSSWTATTSITATASTFQVQNFDGAWEETTGNAIVVWSEGTSATTTPFRYKKRTRTSSTWDSTKNPLPAIGASHIGHFVAAKQASVAGKNHIAVITNSATTAGNNCSTVTNCRASPFIWDGSSFTLGNEWTSLEPVWQNISNVAVESLNSASVQAFYVGATGNTTDTSAYETWIEGTGFSAITDMTGAMGDDASNIQLSSHPNSNEIFITGEDVDADCNGNLWSGTAIGTWDITGCNSAGETALAPLSTTAQPKEGLAFWVISKPYSPWSRNWRFYGDITENDPDNTTDTLSLSENQTATLSQESFVRLRFQFAELTGVAQTDARKKIQWTTDNPDIATSTWTDVGDTTETTAVWRYATVGETCASCSDNTAIGAQRLTGSTQSGTYLSDKDLAAGTNMDHTALALVEYDYPLKAEAAVVDTTYYFRATTMTS